MFRSYRQRASEAIFEEACFERSITSAVKSTVATVIGQCLPANAGVVELSWWSIQCSGFESNENGD